MLRAVIADDDPYMRMILKAALAKIPDVEITAEAETGTQLMHAAASSAPDVVFVDIDMPEMDGMDAARRLSSENPDLFIVFATGYDTYTHEAFEIYAFDYLVKPFSLDRIVQTVERIKRVKGDRRAATPQVHETDNVGAGEPRVSIRSSNKQYFIDPKDIVLVTRISRKTIVYTKSEPIETVDTLQDLEHALGTERFFRCHRGYIINVDMVTRIVPSGNKTYLVKLAHTEETALMTMEKARLFRDRFRTIAE